MKFSKKHYEVVAALFKSTKPVEYGGAAIYWAENVQAFTKLFAHDNSKFDSQCFLMACGIEKVDLNVR